MKRNKVHGDGRFGVLIVYNNGDTEEQWFLAEKRRNNAYNKLYRQMSQKNKVSLSRFIESLRKKDR